MNLIETTSYRLSLVTFPQARRRCKGAGGPVRSPPASACRVEAQLREVLGTKDTVWTVVSERNGIDPTKYARLH